VLDGVLNSMASAIRPLHGWLLGGFGIVVTVVPVTQKWTSCESQERPSNPRAYVGANGLFALEQARSLVIQREAQELLEIHAGLSQEIQY
jgi:hypothetical protein